MSKRIPVAETPHGAAFPKGVLEERGISAAVLLVLDRGEARSLWATQFGEGRSNFSPPKESWLWNSPSVTVGAWSDSPDSTGVDALTRQLRQCIPWPSETPVLYCVSRAFMLSMTWDVFVRLWDVFVAEYDECPLVVPEHNEGRQAIIFSGGGRVRYISQPQACDSETAASPAQESADEMP